MYVCMYVYIYIYIYIYIYTNQMHSLTRLVYDQIRMYIYSPLNVI